MRRGAKPGKAKVDARFSVARKSPKNEGSRLRQLQKRLKEALKREAEALEQQAATSEILRIISSSPSDIQPVFDAIAAHAARLCDAVNGLVIRFDGQLLHLAAHHNVDPERLAAVRQAYPRPPSRGALSGRAILTRAVVHVPDVSKDPEYTLPAATTIGYRSVLAVPMMHEGVARGTILVAHDVVAPFSDTHIALIQTFADQAVIAIENVRLFKELEEKNRALTESHAQVTEALEQQTATAEILRVISSSPTDVQPVFDSIVQSTKRLCKGTGATLFQFDGTFIHVVALDYDTTAHFEEFRRLFPMRLDMPSAVVRTIADRRVVHIADIDAEPDVPAISRDFARRFGYRSLLIVPMLRDGAPVGAIGVNRMEAVAFSDSEIELLKTFADQAVIAIENVRLFKELEASNRDLTEALDQQTATSEILRAISSSPTSVEAVFDTILASALRLCETPNGGIFTFDGRAFHLAAAAQWSDEFLAALREAVILPGPETPLRRVGLNLEMSHVADIFSDPSFSPPETYRLEGMRTSLAVPMLKEGRLVGALTFHRREVRPFTEAQIALIKIFADQAVIAIENGRLFKELQARTSELTRSVGQLTALGEVSRAVSSTLDVETVLNTIVSRASQLAGAAGCSIFEYDEAAEQFELRATHNYDGEFVEALRVVPLRKGEGLMGRAAEMREPIQIPDITQPGAYQSSVRDTLIRFGYRALLAVPLLREDQIIGSLSFNRKAPGEFPPEVVEVLKTFATQSALAIQNARLFREIADKSAQLEAASRHKSEFLANMSHELRTPLNAIIGFSEVLTERMFGELNEKQDEYLKDIHASGQHLLSLINDILDLSKIEAGRMELERSDFDLPNAIENALILVRERASRRGIRLGSTIDERLGAIGGDERKVKQVLLNLLSNALKFTPEGGRIDVGARLHDHVAEVSVADTGIGIAAADQDAVFEEFRQVGAADKKAEGTGLGLALSRKFIELHGGRIWVKSQVGQGSTFTFTLPVRREE